MVQRSDEAAFSNQIHQSLKGGSSKLAEHKLDGFVENVSLATPPDAGFVKRGPDKF